MQALACQTQSYNCQNFSATTAIFGYTISLSKTCVGAQVAVSLKQTIQIVLGLSVTAAHGNCASTYHIKSLELWWNIKSGCAQCLH